MLNYTQPHAAGTVESKSGGTVTVTRASGTAPNSAMVFVESDGIMILTCEQAAELASVLLEVSGMAVEGRGVPYLAMSIRERMAESGASKTRVRTAAGVGRRRFDRILSGEAPMTKDELRRIAEAIG